MKATLIYEVSISREGSGCEYNCKKTFLDEYSGNVPQVEIFNGKFGEIYKTGEFQGKPEWGIKIVGGSFGDDNCFIPCTNTSEFNRFFYINYPKGKINQLRFKRE